MKMKVGCAAVVLAFLCFEMSHAGALKKNFTKGNAEETKVEEQVDTERPESVAKEAPADTSSPAAQQEKTAVTTEKKKIVGDPVVLRINGKKEFRRSQILEDMKRIPPQMVQGVSPDKLFEMLRDQKLNTYLMIEQAKKAGMDRTKEFLERVEQVKEELLGRLFLMKELAPKAENESALKARYTKYLVEFKKGKECKLSHIMLSTEAAAKDVLAALAKGEDFAKLAKDKSEAPSKENNGDEGYIPVDMMPAPIKEKIVSLKNGEYTKEFVKTENGFHIFKVEDSRDTTPRKYEEAKNMLKQVVMHEEMIKMLDRLTKQVKVERFNEDGTPFVPKNETAPAA